MDPRDLDHSKAEPLPSFNGDDKNEEIRVFQREQNQDLILLSII